MAMNLNNLKIFINVADSGSITRTAEALFISQPAVSKAIRLIEEDLGVNLFIRDKKIGIKLTDTGERILPYARKLLLMEEKIYQTAYLSKNMLEGTLRIASLPIGIDHVLVKTLAYYTKKYPNVNVEILDGSTNDVNRMVSEHEAEFGISIDSGDNFQKETLLKDRIIAISRSKLDENEINLLKSKKQFLLCRAALESIQSVINANPQVATKQFKIVGRDTVRLMAQEGLGIGLQSALLVEPHKENYYIYPVIPEICTDLVLIANDFSDLSPAAKEFVNIIHSNVWKIEFENNMEIAYDIF